MELDPKLFGRVESRFRTGFDHDKLKPAILAYLEVLWSDPELFWRGRIRIRRIVKIRERLKCLTRKSDKFLAIFFSS